MWVLLGLLALGVVALGIGAAASSDSSSSDTVQAGASATGEGETMTEEQIAELVKREAAKHPGPVGPAGPAGSFKVTKFACKTDVGLTDPSCGTVYDANGLRVRADCSANGLTAVATVEHALMTLDAVDAEGAFFGSIPDSSIDHGFTLTSADGAASSGTVTFTPPGSSAVILVDFSATYSPGAPQGDCVFVGRITDL